MTCQIFLVERLWPRNVRTLFHCIYVVAELFPCGCDSGAEVGHCKQKPTRGGLMIGSWGSEGSVLAFYLDIFVAPLDAESRVQIV